MSQIQKLIQENQKLKYQLEKFKSSNGLLPYIDDSVIKGGYHVVKNISERDNIDCCHRKLGMKVVVIGDDLSFKEYILKSKQCSENIWEEINATVDENEVFLIEDYSELGEDLSTQRDLNLILKQILENLQQALDGKEDKTNKQDSLTIDGTGTKYPTVDAVNNGLNSKISGDGIINRIPKYIDEKVIGFSNITDNGTSVDINTTSSPNSSKLIFKTTGSGSFIDSYHFISDTYNDIIINQLGGNLGIGKEPSTAEKLDVNGSVRANSYKFILPSTITPQPNMLIPKVDGSGLMWYDNNSVGSDLATTTNSNNYYGLWNDTTKEFINGTLREEADYLQSDLPVKIKGVPLVPKQEINSLFFGTYPQNVTGGQNIILGYNNGKDLTTGYANLLIGYGASPSMTTGIGNITIAGWGSGGYNSATGNQDIPITGKHNISMGTSSNHNITSGSRNIALGNGTFTRITTGSNNIGIGYGAAPGLITGNNNIIIGNYAGGTSTTQATNQTMTNKLVIHNIVNSTTGAGLVDKANSFWDNLPTSHGINTWDTSLITGDFYERWVKFQGKFIIGAGYMPNADTTYTKNIVAKPDGTFGWEDKKTLEINASKGTTFPNLPSPGDLFFNTTDNKHYGFDGTSWNALY